MTDNVPSLEPQREPSQSETAAMIADTLNERQAPVRHSIVRIVQAIGRTQARELLAKTLEIEQNGGMMLPDNSRRRTPGGVFFYLAYTIGQTKDGKTLERPQKFTKKPKKANEQALQPETTKSPWKD